MANKKYVRSSGSWNEITSVPAITCLGSAPSSPTIGQMYFNTNDNNIYVYNGTAWENAQSIQVSDSTSSTSTTTSGSALAVKNTYDLANAAIPKSTISSSGSILSFKNTDAFGAPSPDGLWSGATPSSIPIGSPGQELVSNESGTFEWRYRDRVYTFTGYKKWRDLVAENESYWPFKIINLGHACRYKIISQEYEMVLDHNEILDMNAISDLEYIGIANPPDFTAHNQDFTDRTSGTGSPSTSTSRGIQFVNDIFVRIPSTGTRNFRVSRDGLMWAQTPDLSSAMSWIGTPPTISSIAYGNGIYVAAAGSTSYYTSTNLFTNLTQRSPGIGTIRQVAFGDGVFVFVGATGLIQSSTDGINWTDRKIAGGTRNYDRLVFANGIFVAATSGTTDVVTTSPDGITWTESATTGTNGVKFNQLLTANNKFWMSEPQAYTWWKSSSDGITWTTEQVPSWAQTASDIAYSNGYYALAGDNGQLEFAATVSDTRPNGNVNWPSEVSRLAASENGQFVAANAFNGSIYSTGTEAKIMVSYGI